MVGSRLHPYSSKCVVECGSLVSWCGSTLNCQEQERPFWLCPCTQPVALIVRCPSHSMFMTPLSGKADPRWWAGTSHFGQRGSYFSFLHLHLACTFRSFLLFSLLPFLTHPMNFHSMKYPGWSDAGVKWVTASAS